MQSVHERFEGGFSLIEIMVALALGLLVSAGAIQLFLATKTSYTLQEAMSRVQENGRFVDSFLGYELRMAGQSGDCGQLTNKEPNVIADPDDDGIVDDVDFGADQGIRGFENGNGWTNDTGITHVANTDVVEIRRAVGADIRLTGKMDVVNANIQIGSNPLGFVADDVLIISDCESTDVFAASNVSEGGTVTIAHANNANTSNFLSKTYGTDARVMRFSRITFFVGENPAGEPSLYMASLNRGTQELVAGVEDMQYEFGVDTDGDALADEYRDADNVTSWDNVVSVRVDLLVRSAEGVATVTDAYTFRGNDLSASDKRLRRWFSNVYTVRNNTL